MTVSKTTNACHSYGTTILRGGRLIKWKGQVASLSPSLGQLVASVSPVALGRGLMVGASKTATAAVLGSAGLIVTTSGASAACTPGNLGVYTCSGAMGNGDGDLNTTTTTYLLDVTVSPSTTFNVTSGDAFDLDSSAGITFTNNNSEVTIAGAVDGINAYHDGTYGGALSITTTGTTTGNGTSNPNSGIYAKNKGTDLTINAATTTGGVYGIIADNGGTGALSITTTGTTTGGVDGIQAANSGTGALGIKTTGTTTGTSGNGIDAYDDNTGSVSITTTGTTTGGTSGIRAINYGGGALSITTTGTTTGETGKGIRASNLQYYDYARGTSLTINATDTTGETQGIFADNDGTGALSITTSGTTKGTSSYGIYANNSTAGTSLTINAEATTGTLGIKADNDGDGALSITTTGTTTGTNTSGISANNSAASTGDLMINSVDTMGAGDGMVVYNMGNGALSITTSGTTTGGVGDGIFAFNFVNTGALSITTSGTSTGNRYAIQAYNAGSGVINITATGITTGGPNANGVGIRAISQAEGIMIDAGATTGGYRGILAYSSPNGNGDLTINAIDTTGGDDGIFASISNTANTGDLTINAATTTGTRNDGIFANNLGTGALSITTTGTTTGGSNGIDANNDGTSLTISAATTTGAARGIYATNLGTGALEITTTGTTTGSSSHGIYANNSTAGTSLKITAEDTTGTDGIYAANEGGALEITTTGTTTGTSTDGIFAANFAAGTSLTISAATTTGATSGITAINSGTGALEITTTGATTGTSSRGIIALNLAAGTSLTINAATTTGDTHGIDALNYGTGALSITTSGAITGGTGYGIHTETAAGKTTNSTLNSGAVTSTAGLGIFNNGGDSTTTVNTGASVAGKIVLGDGVDSLNFAGGDFSGVTLFDGGAGTSDILKFSGSSGSVNSTLFSNWETVEINDGSTIAFSNSALTAGTLSINTGGTLNAVTGTGTFAMRGNLSNAGMIAMADAATSDKVTVLGNFTGGGQIKLDVDTKAKTSDQLAIAGNSSGTSQISFTNLTPGEETGATINDVVTVAGTSSATDFRGSLVGGIYTYNLTYDAGDFDLIGALNSTSSTYRVTPVILDGFNQITSLHQRTNQRQIESMNDARMLSFLQGDLIAQQQPNIWLDIGWSRNELQTTSGTDIKNTNRDIAVGIDVDLDADANGSWVLGGSVQYATQSASVSDALGTGSAKTKGNGFGVTATWYGGAGTYVDMQGQVMRLESKISSSAGGLLVEDASSRTNAISMEVGHRIVLTQNEALIPQVQLTRGKVDAASFTDTGGTVVDLGSNETRTGRVGIAYEYVSDDTEFYGIGSILRDFGSASEMAAGNLSLLADTRETWGEIGVGGSYIMDEQTNLFGEVSYRQALNNSDMKAISVNAGIQINW